MSRLLSCIPHWQRLFVCLFGGCAFLHLHNNINHKTFIYVVNEISLRLSETALKKITFNVENMSVHLAWQSFDALVSLFLLHTLLYKVRFGGVGFVLDWPTHRRIGGIPLFWIKTELIPFSICWNFYNDLTNGQKWSDQSIWTWSDFYSSVKCALYACKEVSFISWLRL